MYALGEYALTMTQAVVQTFMQQKNSNLNQCVRMVGVYHNSLTSISLALGCS